MNFSDNSCCPVIFWNRLDGFGESLNHLVFISGCIKEVAVQVAIYCGTMGGMKLSKGMGSICDVFERVEGTGCSLMDSP